MNPIHDLDDVLRLIGDTAWHPMLIAASGLLWWWLASRGNYDRVAAPVFAFSAMFAVLWVLWIGRFAAGAIEKHAALLAQMSAAMVLFVACALLSANALRKRQALRWPVPTVVALMSAHALHVGSIAEVTNSALN